MKEFYGEMIAYAETILDYYHDERDGHDTQISQVRTVFNGCDDLIDDMNAAL